MYLRKKIAKNPQLNKIPPKPIISFRLFTYLKKATDADAKIKQTEFDKAKTEYKSMYTQNYFPHCVKSVYGM